MREPHALSGKRVRLKNGGIYDVEDYWQNVSGGSWMDAVGNPAALIYAGRVALSGFPLDNEVLYGKIGPFGHLMHVSELGDVIEDEPHDVSG